MNSCEGSAYFRSPIGWLHIRVSPEAVIALEFLSCEPQEVRSAEPHGLFQPVFPTRFCEEALPLLKQAVEELQGYFAGERCRFDVPLKPSGTPFQLRVWQELCRIPYGQTRTYGELAAAIGQPRACRAVGMANHRNPVAVMIPCHRVVGAGGNLGGYAAGVERKRWLLDREQRK